MNGVSFLYGKVLKTHLPLEAWDLQTCSSSQEPSLNNDQMLKVAVLELGVCSTHTEGLTLTSNKIPIYLTDIFLK